MTKPKKTNPLDVIAIERVGGGFTVHWWDKDGNRQSSEIFFDLSKAVHRAWAKGKEVWNVQGQTGSTDPADDR